MGLHLHRGRTSALIVATTAAVLAGASVVPARVVLTDAAQRRAAMLAAGVDTMPVGTAGQVERAKQARPAKP